MDGKKENSRNSNCCCDTLACFPSVARLTSRHARLPSRPRSCKQACVIDRPDRRAGKQSLPPHQTHALPTAGRRPFAFLSEANEIIPSRVLSVCFWYRALTVINQPLPKGSQHDSSSEIWESGPETLFSESEQPEHVEAAQSQAMHAIEIWSCWLILEVSNLDAKGGAHTETNLGCSG